jgi:putative hydroxymethylpyrimidine transport system substrate-binding protein
MIYKFKNILILLIVISVYSNNILANEKVTLLLDWFINPDHGPIIIANEKGIFKEEGLEIEIIPPANPADPPKLVAAGKADIAISYQPQLHMQVHEGLPVTRIGTLVATPLNCLLVLEDGPIKNFIRFKRKKNWLFNIWNGASFIKCNT